MSLTLLQGYSSAEEEAEAEAASDDLSSSSDDDDNLDTHQHQYSSSSFNAPPKSHLPSAFDAFSQISAPPQFLNNSVENNQSSIDVRDSAAFRGRRKSKDNKDLPPGAVVEAKAQLVGIHERVRSDIEPPPPSSSDQTNKPEAAAKRLVTATNPDAKDASELLRMCLQCGIPKTYSNARGMVCPECSDRPPSEEPTKKKGSAVKDKEKNKRMKGQSSHATWKSETEMQLRQQFD